MKFLPIEHKNIFYLNEFIKDMGASSKKFRYYAKRAPEDAIANHMVTILLFDGPSIGYGHLDKEANKVWLGICVKDKYCGKGYGKEVMRYLTDSYSGDIYLSVDKDNLSAQRLYGLFSFKIIKESGNIFYMKRCAHDSSL